MTRFDSLLDLPRDPRSVVTVGTFDGVHLGHQALVADVVARSKKTGGPSVVVTFDPHPREVVTGQPVPLLTTVQERAAILAALGLTRLVVLPFTPALAATGGETFIREIVCGRIGCGVFVAGHDHGFGKGRAGDAALLARLGRELGFTLVQPPAVVLDDGTVVSSSAVRAALEVGDVRGAFRLLDRAYSVEGAVVVGDQRGRTLGFPTANVTPDHPRKLMPAHGVYAVKVDTPAGRYSGVANVGRRPTVGGEEVRLEAHLFNFEGDLYGQAVRVEFVERLREERRFTSLDALSAQIREDAAIGRRLLVGV
ncbi:MAG TPA: bifunctional riboflavin kinase/FAD synthetase, partial [Rhodothermales bacterium]|nr:bifunctional riboflavin kinase/FAD synthetase [Rhodothermales bacterium]